MNIKTVFIKTESGRKALLQRGAVASRERLVLVFVDGKNTVESLIESLSTQMSFKEVVAYLDVLQQKGFVVGLSGKTDSGPNVELNNNIKKLLETEMIEFIGPMAKIICADVWEQTNDFKMATQLLVNSLPQDKVLEFRQRVSQKMSKK